MAKVAAATRGRPAIAATQAQKAKLLIAIRDGDVMNIPSRPVVMQLVEQGLLNAVAMPSNGRRGRPVHGYEVTGKGRSLLARAANVLKQAAARAEAAAAAAE